MAGELASVTTVGMRTIGVVVASPDSADVHTDGEVSAIVGSLERVGTSPQVLPWTSGVDWSGLDAIVLKSPWDYSMRSAEFLKWLRSVADTTHVFNHPQMVTWNVDKRYLHALASRGVATTPFAVASSAAHAREILDRMPGRRVVVKPTVSAGSRNTGLFDAGDPEAIALVTRILALGKTPMVMPALDSISERGEHGLIYFNGSYSHAGLKAPILEHGGGYLGGSYTELISTGHPDDDEIIMGEQCLRAVEEEMSEIGLPSPWTRPLYSRIDIARDDEGHPTILEAELFEPSYFLALDPESPDRFARALRDQLDQASADA